MTKLGYNIEGFDLANRRAIIQTELMSYRANWHLCLGDIDLAITLLKHTDKGVIYRVFDPFNEWSDGGTFDNTFWQVHSPESVIAYVQVHLSHLLKYDKLVFSIGNNEPATQGRTADFVRWCVKLADLGHSAGIRFAIAEIATAKSVWHDEVIAGVWDDLIRAMDRYRGFHIFTIHEYTTGILPACLLPDYPLNLDNPAQLKSDNWKQAKINLDSIEGNYHIGRGALISNVRAREIGIEPLPFVVTECAFDWMADVVSTDERKLRIGSLRNAFKPSTNHDVLRGSTGHQKYHEWLMQKTGFAGDWNDYLFEQYRWLVSAYPRECEGLTIFALNHDWDIPEGHDMSHARNDKFRQLVISTPLTKGTPMSEPLPIWNPSLVERMVFTVSSSIRMRSAMATNSAVEVIGSIDTVPRKMRVSIEVLEANGYKWHKFIEDGKTGYFADLDILRFAPVVDDVPLPPVPPTEPPAETPDAITQEQLDSAVQAALEAEISHLLTPFHVDIPIPAFTFTLPNLLRESKAQEFEAIGQTYLAMAKRIREGTPSASQIAAAGYAPNDLNIYPKLDVNTQGVITISNEPASEVETTLTDEILNGADDSEGLDLAS